MINVNILQNLKLFFNFFYKNFNRLLFFFFYFFEKLSIITFVQISFLFLFFKNIYVYYVFFNLQNLQINFIFFYNNFIKDHYHFLKFFIQNLFNFNNNFVIILRNNILILENTNILLDKLNIFWFFIFLFIVFIGLNMVFSNNAIYSLLFLILIYVCSSILLILFNLEFFGLLYTIIYVGAIAVLFLFIIMMLKFEKGFLNSFSSTKYSFILFCFLIIFLFYFYMVNYNSNILYLKYFNNLNLFNFFYNQDITLLNQNIFLLKIFKVKFWIDDLLDLSLIFYTNFSYIFILAGLILLLSIIAPITLTFQERLNVKFQNSSKQIKSKKIKNIFLKI